ncbi:unnamed protein product [Lampetra planeri]
MIDLGCQICAEVRGLDDSLQPYVPSVQAQQVGGAKLLRMSHQELLALGVSKVGHQELLLEAVDLLCALVSGRQTAAAASPPVSRMVALAANVSVQKSRFLYLVRRRS